MKYVGFWGRFGAFWIDFLIFLPLMALGVWLTPFWKYYWAVAYLPNLLIGVFFYVYLVKRFGGTPGKLLLNQRIVRVSGEPVGYREAILRYAVLFCLTEIGALGIVIGALSLTDGEYATLTFHTRGIRLREAAPPWYGAIHIAEQIWIWSEFLVLLTNKKKRALHDFMAGTVVIWRDSAQQSAPADQTLAGPASVG
jgi:uncharacterized RDD family membrane protein YckC